MEEKRYSYEDEAAMLRAVSSRSRLQILEALYNCDRMSVNELKDYVGLDQSTVSHHLGGMKREGVVVCESEGQKQLYRIVNRRVYESVLGLCEELYKSKGWSLGGER